MKKVRLVCILTILISLLLTTVAWANPYTWDSVYNNLGESTLLEEDVYRSKDEVHQYGRGEYLSEGSVEIVNYGNGEIYICADTYAYVYADRILHTVFLDYWNSEENDWIQVGFWEFEKTKEETEDGLLSELTTTLTLTGYPTGRYYRVRGLHGVEYHDELEACATRTDGVLITD